MISDDEYTPEMQNADAIELAKAKIAQLKASGETVEITTDGFDWLIANGLADDAVIVSTGGDDSIIN